MKPSRTAVLDLAWAAPQSRRQGGVKGTACPPPRKEAAVTPKVAAPGCAPKRSGNKAATRTPLPAERLADLGAVLIRQQAGSLEAAGSCVSVLTLLLRRCGIAGHWRGAIRG